MLEFPGPDLFQAVVDGMEPGVYVIDAHPRVVYWNHGQKGLGLRNPWRCRGEPAIAILGERFWSTTLRRVCTNARWSARAQKSLERLEEFQRGHGQQAAGVIVGEIGRTLQDMMRKGDFLGWRVVFRRFCQLRKKISPEDPQTEKSR